MSELSLITDILPKDGRTLKEIISEWPIKEDEYIGADGLYYCKKCRTPRFLYLSRFGRGVRVSCKCQLEEENRQEKRTSVFNKQDIIQKLLKTSGLGKRYSEANFITTKTDILVSGFKKAYLECVNYCEEYESNLFSGSGMYIYGDPGTGKTHLIACMVNKLAKQMQTVHITNFSIIANAIIDKKREYVENLKGVDFLFIDDVGTQIVQKNGNDNWMQEQIYLIINSRYENQKCTLFTSNYELETLMIRGYAEKTVDRISAMSDKIFSLRGKSQRR